jgi:hypothetical protein
MTINNNSVSTSSGAVFTIPKTNKSCRTFNAFTSFNYEPLFAAIPTMFLLCNFNTI